jgi:hypothetical protein
MARTTIVPKMPLRGAGGRRGPVLLWGQFTLGSSGAIASAAGFLPVTTTAGTFGIIKTASKTGRYSLVFDRKYRSMRVVGLTISGPADAAIATGAANDVFYRNLTTQAFDLQLCIGLNAGGTSDADGASGTIVTWMVAVEEDGGKT